MKLFSIFKKNLKTVTRNWIYFLVLFILPFALIVTSAIVLNSNSLDNVRIGLIGKEATSMDLGSFKNVRQYTSVEQCLFQMTNKEISLCIHGEKINEQTTFTIYVDNTRRLIELYTKQVVLEKVFREQSQYVEITTDQMNEKISMFAQSIDGAIVELNNVRADLVEQENMLISYQTQLRQKRQSFDTAYYRIKSKEAQIRQAQFAISQINTELYETQSDLEDALEEINEVTNYLSGVLSETEYNYVIPKLNEAKDRIIDAQDRIESLNQANFDQVNQILSDVDAIMVELEETKILLDQADADLTNTIVKTRQTKVKVDQFRNQLSNSKDELNLMSSGTQGLNTSVNFRNAFNIPGDLVLISFPFVIAIIIAFSSLMLSNKFILNQVNNPSYKREITSPTSDFNFIIGDYLVNLFFVGVQTTVLVLVGIFWFGIGFEGIYAIIISIFLAASILIFVGASLGYLIKSESLSILITIFILMFLLLFSDMLVPSILSGTIVRFFIQLNPFVILTNMLEDTILTSKDVWTLVEPMFKLGVMLIASFFVAYFSRKANKESILR